MSPLWRDQIQVYFAPYRIDWVRMSRGLKPIQLEKVMMPCASVLEQSAWIPPLQQLEQLAQGATKTQMRIVISNHFVRYVVLPPQSDISSPEEVYSYAAFKMREIYGAQITAWELSVSDWDPIIGAICAAVNRELLTRLKEITARHDIKLVGVEPYLASTIDHWQQQLTGERIYFALIETGRLCVAVWLDGIWHSIRNQKILQSAPNELLAILDQEAILSGQKIPVEQVYVFAPEQPELVLPPDSGWHVTPIQTDQMPALAHYPVSMDQNRENECVA